MSECVVRMEMPRRCAECPIQGYALNCRIPLPHDKSALRSPSERPSWCPIIRSLPEGHGRLVDMRDIESMMEDIQTASDESGLYGLYYRDDFDFDGLPTIVPAERSEKDGR